jgi:Protein of unknown function (DUF2795)
VAPKQEPLHNGKLKQNRGRKLMQQSSSTDIQRVFGNVKFPATKQQLIEEARKQNLSSDVINVLQSCPDRNYNSSGDIIQECKGKMKNW